MNRTAVITYSGSLSVASFGLGILLSGVIREAGDAIHAMVGDKPLPPATYLSLATPPVFHLLAFFFLVIAVAAVQRPSWLGGLAHALLLTLIAEAAAIFFCLAGVTVFFSILGNAMSPIR